MAVCRKRLVVAITFNAGSTGSRGWALAAAARSRRVTGFMRNLSAYQNGTEVTEASNPAPQVVDLAILNYVKGLVSLHLWCYLDWRKAHTRIADLRKEPDVTLLL